MLYRPSNSANERVRALFKRRIADGELAYLGDSVLPGARVDVAGRPGYVYVRFPYGKDANGRTLFTPPTMARSSGAAYTNYAGTAVYVAVKYNNELEIVSAHYPSMDRAGINTATLNPLNQQGKWVYPWQLTMGLASAVATALTASTRVTVKSFRHYVGNLFTVFETPNQADKPDLSSYIPTTNEHCYALLWIDTYTNLPVVVTSVAQSIFTPLDATDLQECVVRAAASRPPDGMPLKAFYLANDQDTIKQNRLDVDVRQWLNTPHIWGFPHDLTTLERVRPGYTLVVGPYTPSGVGSLTIESGGRVLNVHKSNVAGSNPTVNDDAGDGYDVGSLWLNSATGSLYILTDATIGAAVWTAVTASGGYTSWTLAGDSGTPQTIGDGNTATIAGGTDLSSVASSTDTVTINHDNSGVSAGTYAYPVSVDVNARGHITSITGGSAPKNVTVDWQYFDTTGSTQTWTKPAGAFQVRVICIGGGGAGGGGRRGAAGSNRFGGSGGAAGDYTDETYDADQLGATESIIIGVGGTGGAGATADNTNGGAAATNGFFSTFGGTTLLNAKQTAAGGLGGAGGTGGPAPAGGVGNVTLSSRFQVYGASGGESGGAGGGGGTGANPAKGPASGAGGGGLNTSNASSSGGTGGTARLPRYRPVLASGGGGTPGTSGTPTGGNGQDGITDGTSVFDSGDGGGGGYGNGANGGNGGVPGGGGGGGGASANGTNAGSGGNGGKGGCYVISYCYA